MVTNDVERALILRLGTGLDTMPGSRIHFQFVEISVKNGVVFNLDCCRDRCDRCGQQYRVGLCEMSLRVLDACRKLMLRQVYLTKIQL